MDEHSRGSALAAIESNIKRTGHHVYMILGEEYPRFAYTIGLHGKLGFEILFAGGADYFSEEVLEIINVIAKRVSAETLGEESQVELGALGSFGFRDVHPSWSGELLLGALDYFNLDRIAARQVVPDRQHWTIDIPDTSIEWNSETASIWRHLHQPWSLPVSPKCTAITNLAALRGETVTEAVRAEQHQWKLIAGASENAKHDDLRTVPLGTMLLSDANLLQVTMLEVGEGLRRLSNQSAWLSWRAI